MELSCFSCLSVLWRRSLSKTKSRDSSPGSCHNSDCQRLFDLVDFRHLEIVYWPSFFWLAKSNKCLKFSPPVVFFTFESLFGAMWRQLHRKFLSPIISCVNRILELYTLIHFTNIFVEKNSCFLRALGWEKEHNGQQTVVCENFFWLWKHTASIAVVPA